MKLISFLIPLIISIAGVIIPINALNSKSTLSRTFFTDEQKLKVKYYNTFMFSTIIAFAVAYSAIALRVYTKVDYQIETIDITSSLAIAFWIFVTLLLITSPVIRWIDNFLIKTQIKYKVLLSEEIGEVYILRMHDKDTCICSKDPNAESSRDCNFFLVSTQELLGKKLSEEKLPKPSRSFASKLFDL